MDEGQVKTCVDYALSILLGAEGLWAREHIAYCQADVEQAKKVRLCIVPSGFFGEDYGKTDSLPALPLKEVDETPFLYGKPKIQRNGSRLIIYVDIVASAYFMLTRYEEMVRRDERDEHGRFPGRQSLPCRAGFIDRPVVEEYAVLLRKWLKEVGIDVPEPNRKFSVLLTHDIDCVGRYWNILSHLRVPVSVILGRQPVRNILDSFAVMFGLKKDPLNNFAEIIKLDSQLQQKPGYEKTDIVYFFLAGSKDQSELEYGITGRQGRGAVRQVLDSGAKIGLHASYQAGINSELIAGEKARLEDICGQEIYRNRHHYLAWREIEDGWALAKAGIKWDSTLGYVDVAGFRLGVCHPIELFDPVKLRPFGIEEHPLLVMDATLSGERYMNLSQQQAFEYCDGLIKQTRKYNGQFVMLWHNTMLTEGMGGYHPMLYRQLLAELAANNEKD
jgi:hypothetical protein